MDLQSEKDIDKLIDKIKNIAYRHSECLEKVSYFGSRATGDNREGSDLDLFIVFKEEESSSFLLELSELDTLLTLDVTIYDSSLDPYFLQRIQEEEVILFQGKFSLRYNHLEKAVTKLVSLNAYTPNNSFDEDVLFDSYITRFQFCYELSWKTLKEYLIENGVEVDTFPKGIFKQAYKHQLITDETLWLQMIKDRNITSHEYNQEYSRELVARIQNDYIKVFENLLLKLKK